jgi:hypothetical protein
MESFERDFPLLAEDPALLAQAYDEYIRAVMEDLLALLGTSPTQP